MRYPLLRQGLLRPAELPERAEAQRDSLDPRRATVSALRRDAEGTHRRISEGCEARLVPGRTAEHGGVELHRAAPAEALRTRACLCGPGRERESGSRRIGVTQARAGGADRRRLREVARARAY